MNEPRADANAAHANRLNWYLQEALIRLETCVGYVPYYVRERQDFDKFIVEAREYAKQRHCAHYFEGWNDTCRFCGEVKPDQLPKSVPPKGRPTDAEGDAAYDSVKAKLERLKSSPQRGDVAREGEEHGA